MAYLCRTFVRCGWWREESLGLTLTHQNHPQNSPVCFSTRLNVGGVDYGPFLSQDSFSLHGTLC